eukprot:GHVT01070935.1.p1 GENE.GHVT01070935.1~~GHVT01070935.1.p1  ORF type:complete len:336 (-),score=88.68 GHVT01070935.1:38-1045(-)
MHGTQRPLASAATAQEAKEEAGRGSAFVFVEGMLEWAPPPANWKTHRCFGGATAQGGVVAPAAGALNKRVCRREVAAPGGGWRAEEREMMVDASQGLAAAAAPRAAAAKEPSLAISHPYFRCLANANKAWMAARHRPPRPVAAASPRFQEQCAAAGESHQTSHAAPGFFLAPPPSQWSSQVATPAPPQPTPPPSEWSSQVATPSPPQPTPPLQDSCEAYGPRPQAPGGPWAANAQAPAQAPSPPCSLLQRAMQVRSRPANAATALARRDTRKATMGRLVAAVGGRSAGTGEAPGEASVLPVTGHGPAFAQIFPLQGETICTICESCQMVLALLLE